MSRVRLQAEVLQQYHEISIFPQFCCGKMGNCEVNHFVCVCVVLVLCVYVCLQQAHIKMSSRYTVAHNPFLFMWRGFSL